MIMNSTIRISAILTILFPTCMGFHPAFSGNVIISGTKLKVLVGTSSVSVSNFVIKNGATLNDAGTLVLKKGLINENSVPNSLGTGTVKLTGTTAQTISGQNTIKNLVINNTSGVTIAGNTTVNGTLTLTGGKVFLGNSTLLLGSAGNISGTPSAAKMIVATGTGELRKNFTSGFIGSFTFPVGDNTNTAEYSPVKINITGGTFGTGNYIGVNLRNCKYPDPLITGNYLNRYWNISQQGINALNCNAVFQYVPADVVGNENIINCLRIKPFPVIKYALANTATHQLVANPITSFGTYTGSSQAGITLSGPTQVCKYSTGNVYITEDGQSNYVWAVSAGGIITGGGTTTSNTVTITWNITGPQTVSVNYNGSANPALLNVTVNPLPVPVLNGPASGCVDNVYTYTTDAGQSNYEWSVSSGGIILEGVGSTDNTVMIKWISRGPQTVSVNYANVYGCSALTPTTLAVLVNPCSMYPESDPPANNEADLLKNLNDTSDKAQCPQFSVYPVPNNGKFTININSLYKENYTISIVNYLGVEVYNQKNLTVDGVISQPIDISSASQGVYMVIIRNAQKQAARRVLIKK